MESTPQSTPQSYNFQSLATKYVIVSDGTEKDGDMIATVKGGGPHTTLTASTVIEGIHPVMASVKGLAGLYVAVPEKAVENDKLRWSNKEYIWSFNKTGTGDYEVVPSNGQDLYWYDSFSIPTIVIVVTGKDIDPPKGQWTIVKV